MGIPVEPPDGDVAWEGPLGLRSAPADHYVPLSYDPPGFFSVAARTGGSSEELLGPMRRSIGALDPGVPIHWIETMQADVASRTVGIARQGSVVTIFARIAGLMATIGVFGVLSHSVSRRFGEYGLRMALGATAGQIGRRILGRAGLVLGIGTLLGTGAALLAGRLLEAGLYGVDSPDPWTLVAAVAMIALAGMVAASVRALRAARSDSVELLRAE